MIHINPLALWHYSPFTDSIVKCSYCFRLVESKIKFLIMDDSDRESQYSDDEEDVYYMWWEDSDESDEENSISEDDSMTDATPTVPILEDPNVQLDQNVSQSTQPNENQMGLAIHSVGRSVASNDQTNKRKLSQRDKGSYGICVRVH